MSLDDDTMTPFGPIASAVWLDVTTGADLALAPLDDDAHSLVLSTASGWCQRAPAVIGECAQALAALRNTRALCAEGGEQFSALAAALAPLQGAGTQQIGIALHDNTGPHRAPRSGERAAVTGFSGLIDAPVFELRALEHRAAPFSSRASAWDVDACRSSRASDEDTTAHLASEGVLALAVDDDARRVHADLTATLDGGAQLSLSAEFAHCPVTVASVEARNCALMLAHGAGPSSLWGPPALNDGPLCLDTLEAFYAATERCLAVDQAPDGWFSPTTCDTAADDGHDNRAFYACMIDKLTQRGRDNICEPSGFGDVVVQFEDRSIDDEEHPGCRELYGASPG